MIWEHPDPTERAELHAEALYIADLLGHYIQRRENNQAPRLHELLAAAREFGRPRARRTLRTVAAFYEAAHDQRH
jgi:hypothetical protein